VVAALHDVLEDSELTAAGLGGAELEVVPDRCGGG
jgi:hypothetical protein